MTRDAVQRLTRALHWAAKDWLHQESSSNQECFVTPEQNGVVVRWRESIDYAAGTMDIVTIAVTHTTVRIQGDERNVGMVAAGAPRERTC